MSRIIDSNYAILSHLLMRLIKIGSDQLNEMAVVTTGPGPASVNN